MCKTTTPPRPAAQDAIRKLPPNTNAPAVIPLQSYLAKYSTQFVNDFVPATPPAFPPDLPDPLAYKRVAFSLLPLRANAVSPYYAGIFDDDTDFSASLVKVAVLFAAGQLLAAAKAAPLGAANAASFNNAVKVEITANADPRVRNANYSSSPVGLLPKMSTILQVSGSSVTFTPTFNTNLSQMIVRSSDSASAFCINRLGYGYISAVLNEKNFFDSTLTPGPTMTGATGRGIWLTANYASDFLVRIRCVNDHPDSQLATTRQMCRLFSMIRLKQLPETDIDTNTLMQSLLNEPKTGPEHTTPWLSPNRPLGVTPLFTILQDKIGVGGLGAARKPSVYSEGLIIKWNNPDKPSQVDGFNKIIDHENSNPNIHLSGEFAVCWQNLLADDLGATNFDGIIEVLNNSISDFLDQKAV